MQPIPTTYNGVTYRSRLEARWRVFFDTFFFESGFKVLYEPRTIFSQDGALSWVPDFEIVSGNCSMLFEIKPLEPNKDYVSYLDYIYGEKHMEDHAVFIMVGDPKFWQTDGYAIFTNENGRSCVQKGFSLTPETDHAKHRHQMAVLAAKQYRFDLITNISHN